MNLPNGIEKLNQFEFAKFDPELAPVAVAKTWSDVFGKSRTAAVDVNVSYLFKGEPTTRFVHLASEHFEDGDIPEDVHERMAEIAAEWNKNPDRYWREVVTVSRDKVLAWERKKLVEATETIARYEAGDWA